MSKYKVGQSFSEIPEDFYDELDPYTEILYVDSQDMFIVIPDIQSAIDDMNSGDICDYQKIDDGYSGYCLNITDRGNVSLLLIKNGKIIVSVWSVV